jgi:hypothetical protein
MMVNFFFQLRLISSRDNDAGNNKSICMMTQSHALEHCYSFHAGRDVPISAERTHNARDGHALRVMSVITHQWRIERAADKPST